MLEQKNAKQVEQDMSYISSGSQIKVLYQLRDDFLSIKDSLEEIKVQLNQPKVALDDQLWTVDEVAVYLHKSKGTIQSHYQNKNGFPRSKKIGSARYWRPKEIIAYAKRP